jgi:hypothetical protein
MTCAWPPAGELLEGATSMKMLTWERPFEALIGRIRTAEAAPMWRMLLIEASSMALMFFCTPLASFVTFATEMAMGDVLRLEVVFYVVALLHLPKLWLALFFVKAVKSTSETFVAARRINAFLLQPEARVPTEPSANGARIAADESPRWQTQLRNGGLVASSGWRKGVVEASDTTGL